MFNNSMPFSMDVVPAGSNNGGMGWGGDWIWIILVFALIWGNGLGGNGGQLTRNDLCSEFAFNDLQNAVRSSAAENNANFRGVDNAVCQLGYNNAQLANNIQMQIGNEFRGLDNAVCQLGYNTQQGFNQVSNQLAQCCCDTKQMISETNYNLATQACQTRQTINDGFRALHDEIVANRIEDKNAQIQAQQQQIFALELKASQEAQNSYLVNQLKPCAIPAYNVPNPNCCYGGCGYAA